MNIGPECPKCGCPKSRVIDGRPKYGGPLGKLYKRRRECVECQTRWNTHESGMNLQKLYARLGRRVAPICYTAATNQKDSERITVLNKPSQAVEKPGETENLNPSESS